VFALVTDLDRLPEWNAIITQVVERPATLGPDAEWVVELKAMGNRWRSRSRLLELDAGTRRFAYRSQTDDGNPSYGEWTWTIAEDPAGSKVTVSWELHPATFWRRTLFARIRHRQLNGEVRASLPALARCAAGGVDAR
jgi:hypothetical protein